MAREPRDEVHKTLAVAWYQHISAPQKSRNPRKTAAISNLKVQIASCAAGFPERVTRKSVNILRKKKKNAAFPRSQNCGLVGTPISTYSEPTHSVQAFSDGCLQLQRVDSNGPELESTMGEAA